MFFDLPKQHGALGANDDGRQGDNGTDSGVLLRGDASSKPKSPELEREPTQPDLLLFEPGPLCTAIIVPKHPRPARPGVHFESGAAGRTRSSGRG